MKHNFNSLDEAINTVVEASQKHAQATETGDYKTANKNYHLINKAVTYLRENQGIEKLKELLKHDKISVKVWAATYLLKHTERQAIAVLEEIVSKSIPFQSSDAKLVLQEWRNGNLNM